MSECEFKYYLEPSYGTNNITNNPPLSGNNATPSKNSNKNESSRSPSQDKKKHHKFIDISQLNISGNNYTFNAESNNNSVSSPHNNDRAKNKLMSSFILDEMLLENMNGINQNEEKSGNEFIQASTDGDIVKESTCYESCKCIIF